GWHESAGRLDRDTLDTLVPGRPVRVQHRSGALWVLNSVALERVGVDEPTGMLFGADALLRDRIPAEPLDLAAVGSRLASYGVTGVTDATATDDARSIAMLASAALTQRLVVTGAPDLDADRGPPGVTWGPAKIVLADHDLPTLPDVVAQLTRPRPRGR